MQRRAMLVVKYGGNAMGDGPDAFIEECAQVIRAGNPLVLVHGGGPHIDAAIRERGLAERRVAGLRVTDAATLAVTEHVLCGTVNKKLVRAFAAAGVRAVGISGQDGGLLQARAMPPIADRPGAEPEPLGFVGEIEKVTPEILYAILAAGMTPVIAPLAGSANGAVYYNVNADSAAGAIAGALRADPYVIITDVPRVRRIAHDPQSGIDEMTIAQAHAFEAEGAFNGGMLPKMHAVYAALQNGAKRAIITGGERALHKALTNDGTVIIP